MRIFINENYGDMYGEIDDIYNRIITSIIMQNRDEIAKELKALSKIKSSLSKDHTDEFTSRCRKFMEKYFHNINLLKNISIIHKSQDEVKKRYPTVFDLLKTGIKISIVYNPIDENDKKYTYGIYFRHNNTIELYLHDLLSSFHPSTDLIRKFLDKLTNDNITRTFIHEITHAYDQQRSKTKALDIHQDSAYNAFKNDPAYKEIMHELYLKLPHEYWARFVEFLYAVDNKINTYDFKQIAPMLMNNPHLNFKILDKDDKKRILARLANIYAKKNQSKTWDLFLYYKDNDFLLDEDLNTPQEIYSFFKSLLNNFKSLSPQQVKQIRQYSVDFFKKHLI